jgi:hypothetical protein
MLYERPYYYAISHILIGFIAVWYPIIGVIGIMYQLTQYILNIRFFPVKLDWEKGNNIYHTGMKFLEIGIGYILGYIVKNGFPTV